MKIILIIRHILLFTFAPSFFCTEDAREVVIHEL